MTKSPLRFSVSNSIGYLFLDNPPKNEMDTLFCEELSRLTKNNFFIKGAQKIKGIIITGSGRHFSSGAKLDELTSLMNNKREKNHFLRKNIESFLAIENLPFPVVAAINGCCIGFGLELALCCSYRIASPSALFSLPETTFGLIPGSGGTIRLPELIKKGKAIELILSGRALISDEAKSTGLIDLIVDRKNIQTTAEKIIHKQKKK